MALGPALAEGAVLGATEALGATDDTAGTEATALGASDAAFFPGEEGEHAKTSPKATCST